MTFRDMFFNIRGRIRRLTFWLGLGFLALLVLFVPGLCIVLPLLIIPAIVGPGAADAVSMVVLGVLVVTVVGTIGWMMTALCAKRLHDSGRSAWGCVALSIPILGWFWLLLECGVRPGTPGPNRYGEPPTA